MNYVIDLDSLVLAGANPGAFIDDVIAHGEDGSGIIACYDEGVTVFMHSDDKPDDEEKTKDSEDKKKEKSEDDETVEDVLATLTEKQQTAVYAMIGAMTGEDPENNNDDSDDNEGGKEEMKHNVFENGAQAQDNTLSHADQVAILETAKMRTVGTFKNALDITAKQVNCKSGSKEANINAGASHYKYSDEYIGEIGTNGWTGDDNRRGLVFDLDENGDYMTWAAQPKSGQNYLVKLLYERNGYNSKGVTYDADTINLGCDIDMHYYKLKNVSWENGGGITGTMRFVQVGGMNSDGTVSNWSNNAYLQFERGVLIKAGWYDY